MKYIIKYLKYDIARCRQTKVESPSFVVVSKVSNNNHASGKSKDSCTEKKTVNNLVSVVYWREHMLKISFYDNVYLKFIGQLRLHWVCYCLDVVVFPLYLIFRRRQASYARQSYGDLPVWHLSGLFLYIALILNAHKF